MQEGAVTHAAPFLSCALALSTMWEIAASVELLERKGILTRQDVLDMIQELRQREPTAIPPQRLSY